ncbi:transcriptional regulator [Arachidicoccus ginsenosidimutans]|uniref:AraC family transcriptional regulator n=1 Tax=Arachidicoccus sp. BS20 TaxID=1850526 RepID=UPI0007F08384|nr:helix-turn-helix domain-containing protein [Arachidicoccus sp. BS20]ANI88362.1 transcriptional regulator [Arachidicoccus sp. BS20]
MKETESIKEFYEQRFPDAFKTAPENTGAFRVFVKDKELDKNPPKYLRRDFYKITLIKGHNLFHYADKTLEVSGDTLVFSNPEVPYTFEPIAEETGGYFCIFKENFLSEYLRKGFRELPMYRIGGSPAFILDKTNSKKISLIFEKIIEESNSDFYFKYDLICNYVMEIIYTALKLQPSEKMYPNTDANTRITAVFMELLERQFPIENATQQFTMKGAKDFAQQLNIHINHLNRAVKATTGKTTSEIIYERLINEAKALLKHTDWNVAEIGFCLGFEDPTHFNHFFRKQTGAKPLEYRK